MSDKMSNSKRLLFFITVMMTNVAIMADSPLYTISNDLYTAWPDSAAILNFALSGPPLIMVLAAFVAPFILKKFTKKQLLIVGSVLFTIGAVFSVAIPTATWFACMRILVGIGQGFIQMTAIAMLTEVYFDENVRNKYMGFYNASTGVIGIFYNYFAGHWAVGNYARAFNVYYLAIPMLIMVLLFLPELDKEKTEEGEIRKVDTEPALKEPIGSKYITVSVILLVYYAVSMVLAYFNSVYIAEQGLGNSILAGYISIVGQIASFATSVLFGPLMKILKKWALTVGVMLMLIEFVLYMFFPSIPVLLFCRFIHMASFGLVFTYHQAVVPSFAPASRRNTAISLITVIYGIGTFLSTYIATTLMGMFDGTFSATIIVYVVIFAVLTVVSALSAAREKAVIE